MRLMPSLLLALSSCVVLPAAAAPQARPVEWTVDGKAFSGVLVHDDAVTTPRPGLVMVPNWMGVTDSAVEKAKAIAGDRYVVLVADVYGKGVRPADAKQAGALAGGLRGGDRATLRARTQAAVDALRSQAGSVPLQPAQIGALGFCFGGTAVLELARAGVPLAGVVSLHGGLAPGAGQTAKAVSTPVLVLNGAADTAVSNDEINAFEQEMDTASADWQLVNFAGAVHCFAEADAGNDPASNCRYDERAAKRAFRIMDGFWSERFAPGQH